ncbi:MAG TPA: hypothetical protein VNT75_00265 [Symbiobacteriaceae bacterium]|nr:hypothetical protein [Symbiobacteriaceae bacterium]
MMQMIVTALVFYLLVHALCLWRPNAGRLFLGFFYLLMALGVNGTLCLVGPEWFVELGRNSAIPFYQSFFTDVVAKAPLLFGIMALVYEATVGLLLLSRGKWVKVGAVMAMIHLIGILPLDAWSLPNAVMAVTFQYLLSKEYPLSLIDQFRLRFAHR